ncbi:MAG: nitrilase [Actinomycetota bacterium]|nr:nitrilase [Actinomycetota bacterium]
MVTQRSVVRSAVQVYFPTMNVLRSVRVAAVQASPVVLDAEKSVAKAVDLIGEAADRGAELVVLPECFVAMYPSWAWTGAAVNDDKAMDEIYIRLWESSVEVPGPYVDQLAAACAAHDVHCVIGVNEREPGRSGSVYNAMLTIGPSGLLARHRKLMPTYHERLFHAFGRGDDLAVTDTPAGRIGGLICWENRMPLARYVVYRGRPQIYVAPTADSSDGWQALMRTVAIESGAFVISAIQHTPADAYPADFPVALPDGQQAISSGGTCILDSNGDYLAGPLRGEEGILVADCDLRGAFAAKNWFDVTGHYSREDVLVPLLEAAPTTLAGP